MRIVGANIGTSVSGGGPGSLIAASAGSKYVREIFDKMPNFMVRSIMERSPKEEILDYINTAILDLFLWKVTSIADFVVSKLVGKDYKIKPLPEDVKKFQKRCQDLHLQNVPENLAVEQIQSCNKKLLEDPLSVTDSWLVKYVEKAQPAHVQLAMRLRRRGHPVEAGTRIEYLVVENEDAKAKLNEKVEDPQYYRHHCDLLRVDRLYYLLSLTKPLDQLLEVVFHVKNFSKNLCLLHSTRKKVMQELEDRQRPRIFLEGEEIKPEKKKTVKKKKNVVLSANLYDYL
jgi:hypothetical protein